MLIAALLLALHFCAKPPLAAAQTVQTLAGGGTGGTEIGGATDGSALSALYRYPKGVAVDAISGNVCA